MHEFHRTSRPLVRDTSPNFSPVTWFKRAADRLKDVRALIECGIAYINGHGVERSKIRGIAMIGMNLGAVLGSEHACGLLGRANAQGRYGLDKNPQEATRWYREMQKCDCRDSIEKTRERAAAWLREPPLKNPPSLDLCWSFAGRCTMFETQDRVCGCAYSTPGIRPVSPFWFRRGRIQLYDNTCISLAGTLV
jgi:hypothetical protein